MGPLALLPVMPTTTPFCVLPLSQSPCAGLARAALPLGLQAQATEQAIFFKNGSIAGYGAFATFGSPS